MGIDISMVIEHRMNVGGSWVRLAWNDECDRNHNVFTALAGITRQPGVAVISEPRGLPEDASEGAIEYFKSSELWTAISHLTLAEIEAYDWANSPAGESRFWSALVPAMRDMAKAGGGAGGVRIVFGFS
jgi:hypothetical protein